MTAKRPVDWRTIEDAIRAWLENATDIPWIWGDQSAPQRAYPYGVVRINPGTAPRSVRDSEQWTAAGEVRLVGQIDFTASCQINVGPPSNVDPDFHARSAASAAIAELQSPHQKAAFEAAKMAVRARGQPQDLNLEVGGQWIARTVFEVRFGVASILEPTPAESTELGYFDKVQVSSTIEGTQVAGSHDLTDELLDPNA